jgi:heat shock protein HtpX
MASLYTHKESNMRKTWLYLTAFLVLVIGVGWIISYFMQTNVILIGAVVLSVAMSFGSYWWSDKIVLAMSHAKPIQKQDDPELYRIVENLAITAGLPMPRLYIIEEAAMNAFATGRDANHAVIAVTRGLRDRLERVELEGVIAHEFSHIGNRDMLLSTMVVVLVGLVAIVTDLFFRLAWHGSFGGRDRDRDGGGQARLVLMLVAFALMIFAPLFATLMQLAISRKRELLADASGALLTRYPEGLARALEKLDHDVTPLRAANDATSHLFIDDPFKGRERTSWLHKLFMSHPPVEDRVKALRGMSS